MGNINVISHPLVQHKLSIMRDKNTGAKEFRELLGEITILMGYEVTRDLPLMDAEVETPIARTMTKVLSGKKLGIVPILRSGLGMVDGLISLVPAAKVGHVGLYRDPDTLKPVEYYCKLPADAQDRILIIADPMLGTGGTASATISTLKRYGCQSIRLMCLIGSPEGIQFVQAEHPDIDIYIAAIDDHLDSHGYIVPGLGDAGDRLFGTK